MAKIPAKLFEQWKKQQEFVKQYSPKETLESKVAPELTDEAWNELPSPDVP